MTSTEICAQAVACRTVLQLLHRVGVRHIVVAPGSRSTPLVQAAAELEGLGHLQLWPVLDERAAGFAALGMCRAGQLAVVLCTSGSATGHLLPSLQEAHGSSTTVIALTADRPVATRGLGAPQTVAQSGIYGPCAETIEGNFSLVGDARRLAGALSEAIARRRPLHINVPLDVPLALASDAPPLPIDLPATRFRPAGVQLAPPGPTDRTLVIAGPHLATVGLRAAWPMVAQRAVITSEVTSGLADACPPDEQVRLFDTYLRDSATCAALLPDRIVRLGEWPASKGLQLLLALAKQQGIAVDVIEPGRRSDPDGHTRQSTALPPELALADWLAAPVSQSQSPFAARWRAAERAAQQQAGHLLHQPEFAATEPGLVAALVRQLPVGSFVQVANSMPIRDLDSFACVAPALTVGFARGTNGIDGTLATAWGRAAVTQLPTVVLLGDCAYLHDLNSLSLVAGQPNLQVIVIDNRGGAIFDYLPAREAMAPAIHERMFRQPHRVDLAGAARACGVSAIDVSGVAGFASALAAKPSAQCIVVHVDPAVSECVHRRWQADLASAARAAIGLA